MKTNFNTKLLIPQKAKTENHKHTKNQDSPKQRLQITNETINVTFSSSLMNNILVIIITKAPREFLVIHLRLVLPDSPTPGHFVGVRQFKLPSVARPRYEALARLVR